MPLNPDLTAYAGTRAREGGQQPPILIVPCWSDSLLWTADIRQGVEDAA